LTFWLSINQYGETKKSKFKVIKSRERLLSKNQKIRENEKEREREGRNRWAKTKKFLKGKLISIPVMLTCASE